MSQLFASGGQSIRVSASTLVLPVNTQDSSPLGRTGWISLQSKGCLRVFSNKQFKSTNSSVLRLPYGPALISIHDCWKNHSFDQVDLCRQSNISTFLLSRLVIAFLPRCKHLLISWLQSPSAVILETKKIKFLTVFIVSPSIFHEVMGPDKDRGIHYKIICLFLFQNWEG